MKSYGRCEYIFLWEKKTGAPTYQTLSTHTYRLMSFLKTKLWKSKSRIYVGKDDFEVTFTHLKPSLIAFTNESEKRRNEKTRANRAREAERKNVKFRS